MRFPFLWFVFLAFTSSGWTVSRGEDGDQDTTGTSKAINVETGNVLIFSEGLGGPARGKVDLGEQPVGRELKIRLQIVNLSDSDIEYDNVETTCACSEITPKTGTLKVAEPNLLSLEMRPLEHPTSVRIGNVFYLREGSLVVAQIGVEYGIERYFGFRGTTFAHTLVRSGENPSEFEIPAVTTANVSSEELEIETSGLPAGLSCEFDQQCSCLRVELQDLDEFSQTVRGKILVKDHVSNTSSTLFVMIKPAATIRLYPNTLRFRQVGEEEWTAMVFADINQKRNPPTDAIFKQDSIVCRCKVEAISGDTFRIRCRLDADQIASVDTAHPATLNIVSSGEVVRNDVDVRVFGER